MLVDPRRCSWGRNASALPDLSSKERRLLARPTPSTKVAFSRFPPVHRVHLEGQPRVDLALCYLRQADLGLETGNFRKGSRSLLGERPVLAPLSHSAYGRFPVL